MYRLVLTSTLDHLEHFYVFFSLWRLLKESTESPVLIQTLLLYGFEEDIVTNLLHVVDKLLIISLMETDRIIHILRLSLLVVSIFRILLLLTFTEIIARYTVSLQGRKILIILFPYGVDAFLNPTTTTTNP